MALIQATVSLEDEMRAQTHRRDGHVRTRERREMIAIHTPRREAWGASLASASSLVAGVGMGDEEGPACLVWPQPQPQPPGFAPELRTWEPQGGEPA